MRRPRSGTAGPQSHRTPPKQTETPQQLFELYQQESDRTKWIEYLKISAQQGHVWAQCELGGCYASGRGVE